MIDKRPALIVRCVDIADLMAAVDLRPGEQRADRDPGAGHNGAGLGTCDDGLVIGLSPMEGIACSLTSWLGRPMCVSSCSEASAS